MKKGEFTSRSVFKWVEFKRPRVCIEVNRSNAVAKWFILSSIFYYYYFFIIKTTKWMGVYSFVCSIIFVIRFHCRWVCECVFLLVCTAITHEPNENYWCEYGFYGTWMAKKSDKVCAFRPKILKAKTKNNSKKVHHRSIHERNIQSACTSFSIFKNHIVIA